MSASMESTFDEDVPRVNMNKQKKDEALIVVKQSEVTEHDVLLGRGRGPNMHPGNRRYREIIYANRDEYNRAGNRPEQTRITREIVGLIKKRGRFLKRLDEGRKKKRREPTKEEMWVVINDDTARLKVGQCLRYKLRKDAGSDEFDAYDGNGEMEVEKKPTSPSVIESDAMDLDSSLHRMDNKSASRSPVVIHDEPQRKYRKVAIPEEPALTKEEQAVLKAYGRGGLIDAEADDDDYDFDFPDTQTWHAEPSSATVLPAEDDFGVLSSKNLGGGYFDSMMDSHGAAYDSNYAYMMDEPLISDAEILAAVGYTDPLPSAQPNRVYSGSSHVTPMSNPSNMVEPMEDKSGFRSSFSGGARQSNTRQLVTAGLRRAPAGYMHAPSFPTLKLTRPSIKKFGEV